MDDLLFADELEFIEEDQQNVSLSWKVMIVDDEPLVHEVTKSVLKDFIIDDRKLDFISAYSGAEAVELLKIHSDVAVIFLDVVMETDDAGLKACQVIREELKNELVRIVLRTGQPGSYPENEVILKYRINDYKEKTELTAQKLFTCLVSGIRSYQDLIKIEQNKIGLDKVIVATQNLSKQTSIPLFMEGVLGQLATVVDSCQRSFAIEVTRDSSQLDRQPDIRLLTVFGTDEVKDISDLSNYVKNNIMNAVNGVIDVNDKEFICQFNFGSEYQYILYFEAFRTLSVLDLDLLEIFSGNIRVALDNLFLHQDIIDTQKELIEQLGEVVERRSSEASKHVHRVAELSHQIALDYGLSPIEAKLIKAASPMHDIGKIAIPDSILLKPGKLTEEELEVMRTHSQIGHDIFRRSKRKLLQVAALIAKEHHEKFNGKGYPLGIVGDNISIEGRITAVADVFDALYHARCYKPAWPIEKIVSLFKEERGEHFDPELVDILLNDLDKYEAIASET